MKTYRGGSGSFGACFRGLPLLPFPGPGPWSGPGKDKPKLVSGGESDEAGLSVGGVVEVTSGDGPWSRNDIGIFWNWKNCQKPQIKVNDRVIFM